MHNSIAIADEAQLCKSGPEPVSGLLNVPVWTLLECVAEGVIVHDTAGTLVFVNGRTETLFGYAREDLLGQSLGMLLPDRFAASHSAHVEGYFVNPRIRAMGQGLELVGKRQGGEEFPIEVSLSYLDVGGEVLGLAFITDITARKQVELALKERTEALDAFAHMVAHDLNGSLSVIVGYSEVLAGLWDTFEPAQVRQYLDTIALGGRKMTGIVNGLLLLASTRAEEVQLQPLEMPRIVGDVVLRLAYETSKAGAIITLADTFPVAMGYGPWVEEVWYNYISNALKYGGSPPQVTVGGTVLDNGWVRYWVRDNGEGLTPEQVSRLFLPLSRLGQRVKGHGLGLTIVRRIVERLGGQVDVESEVGKGSSFGFTLPAA